MGRRRRRRRAVGRASRTPTGPRSRSRLRLADGDRRRRSRSSRVGGAGRRAPGCARRWPSAPTRAVRVDAPADLASAAVAAALAAVVAGAAWVVCGDASADRGSGSVPAFLAAELGAAQALGLVDGRADGDRPRAGRAPPRRRPPRGARRRPRRRCCRSRAPSARLRRASLPGRAGRPHGADRGRAGPDRARRARRRRRSRYRPRPGSLAAPSGAALARVLQLTDAVGADVDRPASSSRSTRPRPPSASSPPSPSGATTSRRSALPGEQLDPRPGSSSCRPSRRSGRGVRRRTPNAVDLGVRPHRDDRRVVADRLGTVGEAVPTGLAVRRPVLELGVALGRARVVVRRPVRQRHGRHAGQVGAPSATAATWRSSPSGRCRPTPRSGAAPGCAGARRRRWWRRAPHDAVGHLDERGGDIGQRVHRRGRYPRDEHGLADRRRGPPGRGGRRRRRPAGSA